MKRSIARGVAAACAMLMLGAGPVVPRAPAAGDPAYRLIEASYFAEFMRYNPAQASIWGVHTYDATLGSMSATRYATQLASEKRYLAKLNALDPATLSPDVALDRQLLINGVQDDLLLNGTLAQWKHNPDLYVNATSGAIYALISRKFASSEVRLRSVIARENAVPALFAEARANTGSVDAATAKVSYGDALGTISFFAQSVPLEFTSVKDPELRRQFRASTRKAVRAARDFAAWIKRGPLAHPRGTYAIGADAYAKRLKFEEALDMPLAQYLEVGQAALAKTKAQFIAAAKKIDPSKAPGAVLAGIFKQHPAPAALKFAAQRDLIALRQFLVAKKIITLPPDADITVTDTPEFQRQTTFAAMDAPGPLEKVATKAYYYVTPVDPKSPKEMQEGFLGIFNDYTRPIISAHEVYPGHFVNFIIDKHLDLSLTRRLQTSSSFAEGWAHYDEQMVVDQGWGNGDPRVRLAQLDEALLRECRYIVGVKEHTANWSVERATQFFMDNAFLPRGAAAPEALRGTQDATYGYYTLGKLEILKLREDFKKKFGADFTLQKFHDALLAHGDPPIPLLRPMLLGSDDDGKVL